MSGGLAVLAEEKHRTGLYECDTGRSGVVYPRISKLEANGATLSRVIDTIGSISYHRLRYDWRVPEGALMQQEKGQAFWIYRGRAQQVQTAQVPITLAQVNEGWGENRRQEDWQAQRQKSQVQQQTTKSPAPAKPSPGLSASNGSPKKGQGQKQPRPALKTPAPAVPPQPPQPPTPPAPVIDDDEPDEL